MNSSRTFLTHKLAPFSLCLALLALLKFAGPAAAVDVETTIFDQRGRLGFFQVTANLDDYPQPEREVIFVLAPSGNMKRDAAGPALLKRFIQALAPGDRVNVLYPVRAFGRPDSELDEALTGKDGNMEIIRNCWVFPHSVSLDEIDIDAVERRLNSIKAVSPKRAQALIGLIESAVRGAGGGDEPIVEVVVIFAMPGENDEEVPGLMGKINKVLHQGLPLDVAGLSRAMSYSPAVTRISFINYGAETGTDRQFRRLVSQTNGFFISTGGENGNETAARAASLFNRDFLRTVRVRFANSGADFVHDDRWDLARAPSVLTVVGRSPDFAGAKVIIEDYPGNAILEMDVPQTLREDPSIAAKWAEMRTAIVLDHFLIDGPDNFMFVDIQFLERQWGIHVPKILKGPVPETVTKKNFTKGPGARGRKSRNDKDKPDAETPPHSSLAEIVPADSLYVLFSSFPSMLAFFDRAQVIVEETPDALDGGFDMVAFEEKIKHQLASAYGRKHQWIYDFAMGEVAVVSDDILNPGNPQITMLFKVKRPLLFKMRFAEYRSKFRSRYPGTVTRRFRYGGRKVISFEGPHGEISSYFVYLKDGGKAGRVAAVSNSLHSLKRIIDLADGKVSPIAEEGSFLDARTRIRYSPPGKGERSAFVFAGKAFKEKLNSRRYGFVCAARKDSYRRLLRLRDAEIIFRREHPESDLSSLEDLAKASVFDAGEIKGLAEKYYYDRNTGAFSSRLFGRLGYLRFADEITESDFPTRSTSGNGGGLGLDGLVPFAIGLGLDEGKVHFDAAVLGTPKGNVFKIARAALSRKPSELMMRRLDWDGNLLSFRTDLFTSRFGGLGISKEQVLLRGLIGQLKLRAKVVLKWRSRKDPFGWVGNEIILGFREVRTGALDFLHNSKGFAAIQVRDEKLAKLFFAALTRAAAKEEDKDGEIPHLFDEQSGVRAVIIQGDFLVGLAGEWLVISNDVQVFREVASKLLSPDDRPSSGESSLGLRLVLSGEDLPGRTRKTLLAEEARLDARRLSYRFGNRAALLAAERRRFSSEPKPGPLVTYFVDEDTGLITSPFFGPEKATAQNKFPLTPPNHRELLLSLDGRISGKALEIWGSLSVKPIEAGRKASLGVPENLTAMARRLRRTSLARFLVESMEKSGPWLSSLAELRLSKLGRSAIRRLLALYFRGDDASRVHVLRVLRSMEPGTVRKYMRVLYRTRGLCSDEVKEELYRTLVHLRYPEAMMDVYGHLRARSVEIWELEILLDERVEEFAPALVAYVLDDAAGRAGREFVKWRSSQPSGGVTTIGLCLTALSEIGESALRAILDQVPAATERQRALLAIAILNMRDINKEGLLKLKSERRGQEAGDFIDAIVSEIEGS